MSEPKATALLVFRDRGPGLALVAAGAPVPNEMLPILLATWREIVETVFPAVLEEGRGYAVQGQSSTGLPVGALYTKAAFGPHDKWLRFEAAHLDGKLVSAGMFFGGRALVELPKGSELIRATVGLIDLAGDVVFREGNPCVI